MKVWMRCSNCKTQKYLEDVKSFSTPPCTVCGDRRVDFQTSSNPPAWWDPHQKPNQQ